MRSQTKEAHELDYRHVGIESGTTRRETFERFCEKWDLSAGRFRVKGADASGSAGC